MPQRKIEMVEVPDIGHPNQVSLSVGLMRASLANAVAALGSQSTKSTICVPRRKTL